jgi:hypothetical protein
MSVNTETHAEITKHGHRHRCEGSKAETTRTDRNKRWGSKHRMEELATDVNSVTSVAPLSTHSASQIYRKDG